MFFCLLIYLSSGPESTTCQEVCLLDAENLDEVFTVNSLNLQLLIHCLDLRGNKCSLSLSEDQ